MIEVKMVVKGIGIDEFFKRFGFNSIEEVRTKINSLLRVGVVYTHSGPEFHADEVFALALLELYRKQLNKKLGKEFYPPFKVIRDRNIPTHQNGLRIDVDSSFLDHHFPKEMAAFRSNGIQYASSGLLWHIVGEFMIGNYVEDIDNELFQGLDACDNGQDFSSQYAQMVSLFVPNWNENDLDLHKQMNKAIDFATNVLERIFAKYNALEESISLVQGAYEKAENKSIIFLPRPINWQSVLVPTEALYVIWQADNKQWNCQAVPVEVGSFTLKKGFLSNWRGLRNEELKEKSGLDLVFCHSSGFFLVANTKEAALEACLKSL